MHILLTNDDGIFAPGLAAMYKQLTKLGRVTVVAPSEVKSAASHSISLDPLNCDKIDLAGKFVGYSVDGSPADCVKLAVMHIAESPIDMVVSGINHGANVGINVYYSGTVAAAMEAAFFAIPAISISAALEDDMNFEASTEYGLEVIKKLLPLTCGNVININIPRLSKGKPKGVRIVPQSTGGFHEHYSSRKNKNGQTIYQLNGGRHRDEEAADTDTNCIYNGYITITALHFDMTDHEKNEELKKIKW